MMVIFLYYLVGILSALKIIGFITWSWWWVLSPVLLPVILGFFLLTIGWTLQRFGSGGIPNLDKEQAEIRATMEDFEGEE